MSESQRNPSLALASPLIQAGVPRNARCSGKVLAALPLFIMGCAVLWSQGQQVAEPAINALGVMNPAKACQPSWGQLAKAASQATGAATAAMHRVPLPGGSAQALSAMQFAARDGARAGCRGQLTCMRAVGLFFGTQTGKTEEVANMIGEKTGLGEAKAIDDVSASDLADFDGLIVGAPTWNTGADEQRSGTGWDDYLDEIRGLSMDGKPVAVFGTGDSAGYGDNFCDAIEEIHSAFQKAGAKMVGYVDSSGYQHTDSKSDNDGKFLGLPCDQDNEDDMTEGRVDAWVEQLKSEGMPLM